MNTPACLTRIEPGDLDDFADSVPKTLQDLTLIIGRSAALALVNQLPGALLPIPMPASRSAEGDKRRDKLGKVVGLEALKKLTQHYGGSSICVPVCKRLFAVKLARHVKARHDTLTKVNGMKNAPAIEAIGMELAKAGKVHSSISIRQMLKR